MRRHIFRTALPAFAATLVLTGGIALAGHSGSATSIYVDRLDRPVVAGRVERGKGERFALVRFRSSSGRPERRFGGNGQVTFNPRGVGGAVGIAPGRRGRLIVAGNGRTGRDRTSDMLVAQIRASGALDTDFGHRGWRRIDFGGGRDAAATALADGERTFVAGTADVGPAAGGHRQNEVAVAALKR